MEQQEVPAVMAVLYYKDNRYTGGRKPKGFTVKRSFERFIDYNPGRVFPDGVLVILQGGDHCVTTLDTARRMCWIMETE
jgi:hypothetical protein